MKTIVLIFLLANYAGMFAMESMQEENEQLVKMPNEIILRQRLEAIEFDHFIEHTKIVSNLADREESISKLQAKINFAYDQYKIYLQSNPMHQEVKVISLEFHSKELLYRALFQDFPHILEQLEY